MLKAGSCIYGMPLTNLVHEPCSHVLVIFSSVEAHEPQWLLAKLFLSQYLIDGSLLLLQETESQPVFQAERINEYPFLFIMLLLLTISARLLLAYGCRLEGCLLWRGVGKSAVSLQLCYSQSSNDWTQIHEGSSLRYLLNKAASDHGSWPGATVQVGDTVTY